MTDKINDLNQFMQKHRIYDKNNKTEITHTLLGPPMGSYHISGLDYEKFRKLYKQVIGKTDLYVVERPKQVGPLVIDFDFHTKLNCRYYKINHIINVVKLYNEYLNKFFDVREVDIKAYVFEKPEPSKHREEFKDGFHIIYPFIPMDVSMRYFLYDKVLEHFVNSPKLLKGIPYTNEITDILDKTVIIRNGIMMHGSRKAEPGRQPYKLTHIFDSNCEDEDITDLSEGEIFDDVSLRKFSNDDIAPLDNEYDTDRFREKVKNICKKYRTKDERAKKEKQKENVKPEPKDVQPEKFIASLRKTAKQDEIELAMQLTDLLSSKRAVDFSSWVNVGWALHNIDSSLLPTFIKFSKRAPSKYVNGCCEKIWRSARNEGYMIGSLFRWAKEDNPEKFIILMKERIRQKIREVSECTHNDIAGLVAELYRHNFKCTSIKKNAWYEFQDHRWVYVENGYTLAEKIATEFSKEFVSYQSEDFGEVKNGEVEGRDDLVTKCHKIIGIIGKLKHEGFLSSVMSACAKKMKDSKFEFNLDSRLYLIGFENGVYDLENGCFRKGTPDDYISKSTGYDYVEFDEDDETIKEVDEFFDQVQMDKDMKEYIMRLCASFLDGTTRDQKFLIWTGVGANGKSVTIKLLQNSFGGYFGTMPITTLTRKRDGANNANPFLADKRGVRIVVFQEPEYDEVVHVGQMKELTGGDRITTRALYGDPFDFIPQFKMILICNKLPHVPARDYGTWRRMRVAPWETEFVPQPKKPNQRKLDPSIQYKPTEWREAFMWLLINKYYKKYISDSKDNGDGLKEPAKVTAHTEKYKRDSDIYYEFITSCVIRDEAESESATYLYSMFRNWYGEAGYLKASCPQKKDFLCEMENKGFAVDDETVMGLKFKATIGTG